MSTSLCLARFKILAASAMPIEARSFSIAGEERSDRSGSPLSADLHIDSPFSDGNSFDGHLLFHGLFVLIFRFHLHPPDV